jgi:cyclic pyranopterin phosphate synthase
MKDSDQQHSNANKTQARGELSVGDTGMNALREGDVPKGDPFIIAKTAAKSGVNQTPEIVPESQGDAPDELALDFELHAESVTVTVTTKGMGDNNTGTMAMTAASIALLNLYDLLKPIEDDVEMGEIELI